MVVRLQKDQFTAGDMNFSVRRRFRPSIGYLKQFYPSGYMTAEASADFRRGRMYKESDEYFMTPEQKEEEEKNNVQEEKKNVEEVKEIKKEVLNENILGKFIYPIKLPASPLRRGRDRDNKKNNDVGFDIIKI